MLSRLPLHLHQCEYRPAFAVLFVAISISFSGCSLSKLPSQVGGLTPTAGASDSLIPAEVKQSVALLDVEPLAKLSRNNPFISLVEPPPPPPKEEAAKKAAPSVNPFEGLTVGGILYRSIQKGGSMAIINLPGEKSSKIVHSGDILVTSSGVTLQVQKITQNSIIVGAMDASGTLAPDQLTHVFTLPSLIGYHSKAGSDSDTNDDKSSEAEASNNDSQTELSPNTGKPGDSQETARSAQGAPGHTNTGDSQGSGAPLNGNSPTQSSNTPANSSLH